MNRATWMMCLLAGAAVLVHGRVVTHEFTWWDDHETLHQNPSFNPPTVAKVMEYWDPRRPHMGLYVPVTYTVWGLVASIAYLETPETHNIHLNPWLFHLASVLVHAGTALGVFLLLREVYGRAAGLSGCGPEGPRLSRTDWAALTGALVFATHPVQVEAVAWTSGMKDLLGGFFGVLALWQFIRASGKDAGLAGMAGHSALAVVFAAMAMLSKPSTVVLPLMAGVLYWLVAPERRDARCLWFLAVMAIVSGVVMVIARAAQPASHVETAPLWARPLVAGDAVAFYLGKLLWPANLAVDYGRTPRTVMDSGWAYVTWIVPAAIGVALLAFRRRAPLLPAAGMLMVLPIGPVLGLLPFEFQGYSTVSDHYLYLAMIGPAMVAGWIVAGTANRRAAAAAIAVAALVVVLSLLSIVQAGKWENDLALWRHNLRVNPRSWLAYNNLGFYYERNGQPEEAGRMYARSVQVNPDFLNARDNLARNLYNAGRYEEAIAQWEKLIESAMRLPERGRPDLGPTRELIERARGRSQGRP